MPPGGRACSKHDSINVNGHRAAHNDAQHYKLLLFFRNFPATRQVYSGTLGTLANIACRIEHYIALVDGEASLNLFCI